MSETTNYVYKQLKQKTFSDGETTDKVDIYPVIGFDEGAFTGSQEVVLPINHGGTGANTESGARDNLGVTEELSNLKDELIGTTNDSKESNTINGAKNYAKNQANFILKTIQGEGFDAEDLQNLKALSDTLKDDSTIITTMEASIEDRVKKTDIFTYDGGGIVGDGAFALSGGAVGYNTFTQSGGAIGNEAWSGAGFAGGDGAYVGFEESLDGGGIQKTIRDGGAIGYNAQAQNGFAGGKDAKALGQASVAIGVSAQASGDNSIAIGQSAIAQSNGCSLGIGSEALDSGSVAIGAWAKVAENVKGAVQLGYGTNENGGTLQFRNYQLVNAEGRIPSARLYEVVDSLPESATDGTIVFLRQQTT